MRTKIEVDPSKLTRRSFFSRFGDGVHGAALSALLAGDLLPGAASLYAAGAESSPPNDLKPRKPHFPPKAKSVIHLPSPFKFARRGKCGRKYPNCCRISANARMTSR